ncbi:phospholipid carrier-dependent glycosyltransferase [Pseudanabaena sp. FACHB-1998]|uniref:phospholipid carrier-dependent glycosyltransferase n=1 Tax=Pseudanabaena sp. FACHB-1998 TaxID=2692858 RepID=UPI001680CACA|nr:phospholipid carrier-dependent glycosyltransferase [Pseudanabaena sp. FACHB-1998]MBD2178713.1 phospholipid carrier-dependent glycosyltransferase [Pseudanabaena sp. FACHB-1998]
MAINENRISYTPKNWLLITGALLILIGSLGLRLWDLDRFAYPVFDEVHFPKFAENYLNGNPPNDGHPPLGKYLIALGILLFGHNEIGYRIASATFGSLIPLLVIGLVYQLTRRSGVAVLAGLLTFADGLLLVESRYGLMNVFLVAFGLISQIFLLAGLERQGKGRLLLLSFSGIMLGACAGVKWNGLGFWLMTFSLMAIALIAKFLFPPLFFRLGILKRFADLPWYQYLVCFIVLPIVGYVGQWTPHVIMVLKVFAPNAQGWEWLKAFVYHFLISNQNIYLWNTSPSSVGSPDHPIHPYCSSPASWFLSMRPVGYYFHVNGDIWQDVHALGNPILWWLSSLAMVAIAIWAIAKVRGELIYVAVGYAANYFPWLIVKRCLFIYHYMSPLVFSFVALAMIMAALYQQKQVWARTIPVMAIAAILSSQIFFMPIWLGLPLSPTAFYERMWFQPKSAIKGFDWI